MERRPTDVYARLTVPLEITIRTCVADDLPHLEWFGMFTPHREIIRSAYQRQQRGENLMLVADAGGFPVGQVWIDLERKRSESTGIIWAARVLAPLQRRGIGARLMKAAERALRERGFRRSELGVEKGSDAGKFYERLGYRPEGTLLEEYSYTTPRGDFVRVPLDQIVYRKNLHNP